MIIYDYIRPQQSFQFGYIIRQNQKVLSDWQIGWLWPMRSYFVGYLGIVQYSRKLFSESCVSHYTRNAENVSSQESRRLHSELSAMECHVRQPIKVEISDK